LRNIDGWQTTLWKWRAAPPLPQRMIDGKAEKLLQVLMKFVITLEDLRKVRNSQQLLDAFI
jgi:hypothetical protein